MPGPGQWDAYLKIEGLKGEATRKGHEEQIKIKSFSFGAVNPGNVTMAKSATSIGAGTVKEFTLAKLTDAASPVLFQKCMAGKHFDGGVVTLYNADDPPVPYLSFTFKELYVTDISWGGSEFSGEPEEDVTFTFSEVQVKYTVQGKGGTPVGDVTAGWSLRTGAPV